MSDNNQFEGTSNKGSFQQALDAAIQAALDAEPRPDHGVKWSLVQTRGVRGTLLGSNDLTVIIAVLPD